MHSLGGELFLIGQVMVKSICKAAHLDKNVQEEAINASFKSASSGLAAAALCVFKCVNKKVEISAFLWLLRLSASTYKQL